MQGEFLAVIIEPYVAEGHVAHDRPDPAFRQLAITETLDADVLAGMQRLCDSSRYRIQLDADEAIAVAPLPHEIADATTGFQHGCVGRDSEPRNAFMDRSDNGR